MPNPQIGQRYVHNESGLSMKILSERTDGYYRTTRRIMHIDEINAEYTPQASDMHVTTMWVSKAEKKAAQRIYGTISACFRAGLKAGGYNA
jgi:hypothetical protein